MAAAQKDHDANLIALLNRCRTEGLKLNRGKLRLNRTNIIFMGHELTVNGLRPSAQKIEAINNCQVPLDKAAIQRLLGLATFLARFCPNFSETTSVLRELLKKENEFFWDVRHQEASEKLKKMLTTAPVLQYFSPTKDNKIQCDASQELLYYRTKKLLSMHQEH